jgi:streptomycin 6-kinase
MADQGLTLADWRDTVPQRLSDAATAWGLTPGEPYAGGWTGYATRVALPDGAPAALKLIWPHRESEHEADALEAWDGDGAVRLLARDDEGTALLLERCEPGAFLSTLDLDAALDVYVDLLPRLWKPAGAPFRPQRRRPGGRRSCRASGMRRENRSTVPSSTRRSATSTSWRRRRASRCCSTRTCTR